MLWLRDAHLPLEQRAPLVVAHDWHDAERRTPLTLTEALDAFLEPPLDRVEIDIDIKLPGREEEIVEALQERDLVEPGDGLDDGALLARPHPRAGTGPAPRLDLPQSDQGLDLEALGQGRRCWRPWWRCATACPASPPRSCRKLGVEAMWVYHPLVSPRLARITKLAGVELIAWTVDDLPRMHKLVAAGVDGLVSNDPRLFHRAQREPPNPERRSVPVRLMWS